MATATKNTIKAQISTKYAGYVRASGQVTIRGVRYVVKMREFSTILHTPDLQIISELCTVTKARGGHCPDGARAIVHNCVLNAVEAVR